METEGEVEGGRGGGRERWREGERKDLLVELSLT
jgi:hypothetical protein